MPLWKIQWQNMLQNWQICRHNSNDIITVSVESFPLQIPEVDDTNRINRALASFNGKSGKLLLPRPLYVISSDINVTIDNLIIEGNGFSTMLKVR